MSRAVPAVYRILVNTTTDPRFPRAEITRNGVRVAYGWDASIQGAVDRARHLSLYNACLPEREGSDRAWLARYNAHMGESAGSLHDARKRAAPTIRDLPAVLCGCGERGEHTTRVHRGGK